jgi:hypothetical protein
MRAGAAILARALRYHDLQQGILRGAHRQRSINAMKKVHAARHAMDAHAVRGFLESQGIEAIVRGEFLTGGWGELPVDVCSVWITNDAQYERANALLVSFLNGDLARELRAENWRCPKCGEQLEGQFTVCWSCGTVRPG